MEDPNSSSKYIFSKGLEQTVKVLLDIVAYLKEQPLYLFGIAAMILAIVGAVIFAIKPNALPSQLTLFPYALLVFSLVLIVLSRLKMPQKPDPGTGMTEEIDITPPITSPSLPLVETLGVPTAGKLGLLVDLSHNQGKWPFLEREKYGSIFNLSPFIPLLVPPPNESVWDIREIEEIEQFIIKDLTNWRGLIFGMPFKIEKEISQQVCDAIIQWVHQGGRLILMGYELGERHHLSNLNTLTDRAFGIRFNSDIIAPSGWTPSIQKLKPYDEEIIFDSVDSTQHPVLKDVKKLCMRNICTLTVEPGSSIILTVGKNEIYREVNPKYVDGWTEGGTRHFELVPHTPWFPVIAEAPRGLCDKGRVIAVGTWDFFSSEQCFKDSDNYTFVKNLLEWAVERK